MKNFSYTIQEGEHKGKMLWSGRYCAVCSIPLLRKGDEVLVLVNKRGKGTPDYQGKWNLVCGYLEGDEMGEECCSREILEETGYKIPSFLFELNDVITDPDKDKNVTLRYIAFLGEQSIVKEEAKGGEENEVDAVMWMPLENYVNYEWAFNHKELLKSLNEDYNKGKKPKTKKTLIIIDPQLDFIIGSLAVPGAEDAMKYVAGVIRSDEFDHIIISKDWHIVEHPSFKEQGGPWPPHCIGNSTGSMITPVILDAIKDSGRIDEYYEILKGWTKEAYSAFENFDEDARPFLDNHEVYVCGLAGDFCVKESTLDLIKHGYKPTLLKNGIASISKEDFMKFVEENNIKLM